jgi:hypothetical protein
MIFLVSAKTTRGKCEGIRRRKEKQLSDKRYLNKRMDWVLQQRAFSHYFDLLHFDLLQ